MAHNRSYTTAQWQQKLHEIIFEADTPAGKLFDVILIISIILSVITVLFDSVRAVDERYGNILLVVEWFFTLLFTIEYAFRLMCVRHPTKYMISFFGIIDLLAIIPTYLSIILPGSQFLIVIRVLRILRVFRVFKLVQYLGEANLLLKALRASRRKIMVFLFVVLNMVIIFGSLMYVIEGEQNGFTSIPRSIYWAIVTLTTVGYGDISPQTNIGQILASMIMIVGYAIIAVPTGIVTVELSKATGHKISTQACPACSTEGHDSDATYCKFCGSKL
ncbi:MAG: ion transporter [Desulfobacterales bacterium]|nr:ion transporter [Desulfobacterales bacterium]